MEYYIKTFGCQMNVSDSERIATFLEVQGFLACEEIKDAELVIFNTCGVKQTAENRAYSMINNLRKKKLLANGSQSTAIIMTGCLANRADVQKRMKNKVDLFFQINDFKKFENWLIENSLKIENLKLKIQGQNNLPINKEQISYLSISPKHANTFEAYVPIMTGCNNFCSYCVVPNARGREVSRPAEEILSEIKDLVARGYKNIILLGQNVNSYRGTESNKQETINNNQSNTGHKSLSLRGCIHPKQSRALLSSGSPLIFDYKNSREDKNRQSPKNKERSITFPTLLRKINAIPGKFWIQFVSSHPKDMSDELIEVIAKSKKVCENVHLPLQAGDDEILRRMNRNYTQKHYLNLLKKIKLAFKKNKPGKLFSISSDIIVGFPSETRKQFLQSAKVMEKAKFDMVFFGQFSPRPETTAWKMKNNVSQKEKARREKFLNEILKKTAYENNQKYVDKIVEVLIEKKAPKAKPSSEGLAFGNLVYFGKTRTLKNVKIVTDQKDLFGKIVKVKIIKANVWNLEGKV